MAGEWRCRECHAPLKSGGYVVMPPALNGIRGLCISCVDRLMHKYHVGLLHELMPRYIKEQQQDNPLKALQERVRQLEALLDERTDPNQ